MSARARQSLMLGSILAMALLGITASASVSRADVDADVRAGLYPSQDAVGVGAGLLTNVGTSQRWFFNPNAEVAIGDEDMVSVNGDFHYDFAHDGSKSFWMGGGPAMIVVDEEHGGSSTDLGINVLAGIGKTTGSTRPFAQLKGVMSDNSGIALVGGVRF